jgi:hypothetical protein
MISVPTIVKIDVEGAESQVLEGMTATLERDRPMVLVELDGPDAAAVQAKVDACRRILEQRAYVVTRLESAYPGNRWHVEHYLAVPRA